jgi:cytochrome P450
MINTTTAAVKTTELPPGPRNGLFTLLGYLRDPYGSTERGFLQHGDPCTVRPLGGNVVMTARPELIKLILGLDPATLDPFGVQLLSPILGAESLMMLGGERHRAARKLLTPPFHGARMRAYARIMNDIAERDIATWPQGRPFWIQPRMQAISLRVILHAVLGLAGDEALTVEKLVLSVIASLSPSVMFIKALQHNFGGLGPWAKLQRTTGALEAHLNQRLDERRRDSQPREDILSMILEARYDDGSAMTNRQVFETMMTLIIAGHETTALSLAWALWLIHRHPAVLERLTAELATVDAGDPEAVTKLPYLEAVCHETMRIKPIASSILRLLKEPLDFAGCMLPPGTALGASIIGLHRDQQLYPEPHAFLPERFLERSFAPWEFIPFGGGNRRCIGAAFALFEMKIVLAAVLRARKLTLVGKGEIGEAPRSTVIGPRKKIRFIA